MQVACLLHGMELLLGERGWEREGEGGRERVGEGGRGREREGGRGREREGERGWGGRRARARISDT